MLAFLEAYMGYILLAGIVVSHFIPSPSQMVRYYDRGKTLLVLEDYAGAKEQFSKIIDTETPFLTNDSIYIKIQDSLTVTLPMAAYYQIGNIDKKSGNYPNAIRNFIKVRQHPGNDFIRALAQYQVIQCEYLAQRYEEAIAQADTLIQLFPNSPYAEQAYYNNGWAYFKLRNYPGAVKAFEDLVKHYPHGKYTLRSLMKMAESYEKIRNWDQALATYQTVIKDYTPKSFSERDWSTVTLQKLKSQAQTESQIALGQDSEVILEIAAKANMKIAEIYEKLARWNDAINQYTSVINTFIRMTDVVENAYLRIAEINFQLHGVNAAVAVYSHAMDNSMSREFQAKMQYSKVLLLREKGQYQRAIQELTIYREGYQDVAGKIGFPLDKAAVLEAQLYFDAGQYAASATTYQALLDTFPTSDFRGEALFNQALAYYTLNKWQESLQSLQRLRSEYPRHPLIPRALLQMGRILMEQKQFQPALALYDTVLTRFSGTDQLDTNNVLLEIGYTYRDQGQPAKAIEYLKRIASVSDYYGGAMSEISEIYLSEGKTDAAQSILAQALNTITESDKLAEFHYFLGRLYLKTRSFEMALNHFNLALDSLKNQQLLNSALVGRGTIYFETGRYPLAIADFEKLLTQPDNANFLRLARDRLINAYAKAGEVQHGQQRIDEWLAVVESTPDRAEILILKAEMLLVTGDFPGSRKVLDSILKLDITPGAKARAYYFKGNAFYQEKNFPAALTAYNNALPLAQQADIKGNLVYQIGLCHFLGGEYVPAAFNAFHRLITEFPSNTNREYAFYYRAFSQMNANDWGQAIKYFKIFHAEYPESELDQEVIYQIGEAYYNAKQYASAVIWYRQVQDSGLKPQSLYNIAWSLVQLNQTDSAMVFFQRVATDYPKSDFAVFSQFTVGDYYYNDKDYKHAVPAYKKVVERYPGHELATKAEGLIKEIGEIESYRAYAAAMVYFDDEDWPRAIEELQKVLAEYSKNNVAIGAMVNIGSAYEQLGKYQKALEYFDRVAEEYQTKTTESEAVAFAKDHAEWIRKR